MHTLRIVLTALALVADVLSNPVARQTSSPLIDVHHHFVTDFFAEAINAAGGDPAGWKTPTWNVSSSLAFMDRLDISTAIFSLTTPGALIAGNNASIRALARATNKFCAGARDQYPSKFGFFAALPDLFDTNASLAEINYAMDVLGADGVTLFTRYGDGNYYLGHPSFEPIWAELDRRNATVFVHPTTPVDLHKVASNLLQPLLDFPHETTRTAADLIFSGTKRRYPNAKVILSHAGGTLPWLISRLSLWRQGTGTQDLPDGITYDQAIADFKSFYFDLALSSSPEKIALLLETVSPSHIMYGSDFPYAPFTGSSNFKTDLDNYPFSDDVRDQVYFQNAVDLIPRLAQYYP